MRTEPSLASTTRLNQPLTRSAGRIVGRVGMACLVAIAAVGCDRNPQASLREIQESMPLEVARDSDSPAAPPASANPDPPANPEPPPVRPANATVPVEVAAKPQNPKQPQNTAAPASGDGFSVMTWNLEWFFDNETADNYSELAKEKATPDRGLWNWRRDAVAGAIAKAQPTVLALQEIEGRRVLWYLTRALNREHALQYDEYSIEGADFFTEQDVGLLVTQPADVLWTLRGNRTRAMGKAGDYGSVTKHLIAMLEVPVGDHTESVLLVNVHLRSKPEADSIRAKQAASVNYWITQLTESLPTRYPVHLIVTGDFNTEQPAGDIAQGSELDVLMTRQTDDPADDLVDAHQFIPNEQARRTHLLPGRQFDRLLLSRSLVEDTPDVADLVLESIQVRQDLAIQGQRDEQQDHWERYWDLPETERDLSDHYPVMATFEVQ